MSSADDYRSKGCPDVWCLLNDSGTIELEALTDEVILAEKVAPPIDPGRVLDNDSGMFLPGQAVVCVDDAFPLGIESLYNQLPKKGNTYHIRDLVPGCDFHANPGEVAVYLTELRNPGNQLGIERGFKAERFTPLETDEIEEEDIFLLDEVLPSPNQKPTKSPELIPM